MVPATMRGSVYVPDLPVAGEIERGFSWFSKDLCAEMVCQSNRVEAFIRGSYMYSLITLLNIDGPLLNESFRVH